MTAHTAFSATEPLRRGMTVLEASAGTGKTFQISTQVVRLVAEEGVGIDRILVVTFTRAATDELVDRVRRRLYEALSAVQAAEAPEGQDPVLERLWKLEQQDAGVGRRLKDALRRFDEATITTIHGFCQRILQQNAFESLADCDVELLTDDRKLQDELRDDVLARLRQGADAKLREFLDAAPSKGGCGLADDLPRLLAAAVHHRDADLEPAESAGVLVDAANADHLDLPSDPEARAVLAGRVRADVARFARNEMARRAQALRLNTFDDLLRKLAFALGPEADPKRRQRLAEAVQQRYSAALIDEFQDTDSVQWTIFRGLFGGPEHYLYLIGDPKQAIYGFRGANVHVYLEAVRAAGEGRVFTMATNYRSDKRLVQGLNHLWREPGVFGGEQISYVPVQAHFGQDRLHAPSTWASQDARRAGLQLRFFDGLLGPEQDSEALLSSGAVSSRLAHRVAEDVVQVLKEGWTLDDEEPAKTRPLGPRDVAILVRSHHQAEALEQALHARDVPAVRTGAASVFASAEAGYLQDWLTAVVQGGRDAPARRAAVTPLFSWTAPELARLALDDAELVGRWDSWLAGLGRAAITFERRGFMVAFRGALDEQDVLPHLLRLPQGERQVTNLLHLAELVHAAQQAQRLTPTATLAWLQQQRARVQAEEAGDAELRLERDDDAVRVLTMHKSKGLQFPVVFVPYLWDGRRLRDTHPLIVPRPSKPSERVLCTDVDDGLGPRAELLVAAERDAAQEGMRLAYVALTRARHRCYVYGGPHKARGQGYETSPLAALLHKGQMRAEATAEDLFAEVQSLVESAPLVEGSPTVAVSRCALPGHSHWSAPAKAEAQPRPRLYRRGAFDSAWRIHSYTSLTKDRHGAHGLEPNLVAERGGGDDAPQDALSLAMAAVSPDAADVPLAGFAAGPQAGTFLHEVLERLDFEPSAEDPQRLLALKKTIDDLSPRYGFSAQQTEGLDTGLAEALSVPLGGPLKDFRLLDLQRPDRLDELRFDLALQRVEGQDFWQAFTLGEGGQDRLHDSYVQSLRGLELEAVAGFLTGSIDLVFRHGGGWFVVDYKSNRIDPERSGRSPLEHYGPAYLDQEMQRHHYLLQAYLYALALHRFLRHRMPETYSYSTHFGGVAYLFLRGMTQPDLPMDEGCRPGVYHLRPSEAVILQLDVLFGHTEDDK